MTYTDMLNQLCDDVCRSMEFVTNTGRPATLLLYKRTRNFRVLVISEAKVLVDKTSNDWSQAHELLYNALQEHVCTS